MTNIQCTVHSNPLQQNYKLLFSFLHFLIIYMYCWYLFGRKFAYEESLGTQTNDMLEKNWKMKTIIYKKIHLNQPSLNFRFSVGEPT